MLDLSLSIALHVLLGIGLAVAVWAVGFGWLRLLSRRRVDGVHAYALGLLVATAASFLALLSPWFAPVAGALIGGGALGLFRARVELPLRRALTPLAWALPGVVGLPLALGFLLHGPTDDVDSSAYGDMLYYVNKVASLTRSVVPFYDLLAEGQRIIYTEAAPSFIGAALEPLPGFDEVLFQAASTPAFLLAALCIGIALMQRARPLPSSAVLAVSVLAVASVPYPTWIVESPPVAFALPLAFSVDALLANRNATRAGVAAVGSLVAVDLFITKVVGLIPLGIVVTYALVRGLDRRTVILVATALAVGAGVAIAALFATAGWYADLLKPKNYPGDALRGLRDQLTRRDTQAAAPAVTVAAELLLLILLARARIWVLGAALVVSTVGQWFVGGYGFDIAVGMTVLLAALAFVRLPDLTVRHLPIVASTAVLFAVSAWFRDISAARTGFVFVLLFAATLFVAFAASSGAGRRWALPAVAGTALALVLGLSGRSFLAFAVAVTLAVLVLAAPRLARIAFAAALLAAAIVGLTAWRTGDFTLSRQATTLTTDDYDIWRRVERLVPWEGLVFTSETGSGVDSRQGWNNYPSVGRRQLYLAGWYDGRLTSRPVELARRLRVNSRVLSGELSPQDVAYDRAFSSFFAVVPQGVGTPPTFRRMYANGTFAIYRIES